MAQYEQLYIRKQMMQILRLIQDMVRIEEKDTFKFYTSNAAARKGITSLLKLKFIEIYPLDNTKYQLSQTGMEFLGVLDNSESQ